MQLIEIVDRETVQQITLTKSSINFLGEAIGIGSCASGVIGQILHLLQPHNLRRFKQSISPLPEEDLRRTNREILVTRQSKHRVDAVEQTRAKELRATISIEQRHKCLQLCRCWMNRGTIEYKSS